MKKFILVLFLTISFSSNSISLLTGVASNSLADINTSSAIDLAASAGSLGALGVADSASAAYDSTPSGWSSSISPSAINSFSGTLSEMFSSGSSFLSAVPSAAVNVISSPFRASGFNLSTTADRFFLDPIFKYLSDLFKTNEKRQKVIPEQTLNYNDKTSSYYIKDPSYFKKLIN